MSEMTDEIKNVLEKVEKLLRLAAANPNEAEAASATAKAQDLLTAYNLDMAAVEEVSGGTGKRAQEDLLGGRYEWQRNLWEAVAELNFCTYWNEHVFIESVLGTAKEYRKIEGSWRWVRGMWQHQHRIIGRVVNIAATKAMATYLENVCDRLTKERVRNTNERANGRWANSFREGLTHSVISKIYDRRAHLLDEERRQHFERMASAATQTSGEMSTATALTISTYSKSEREANIDFRYGEGTSAKWAARRAEQAAADRAAEEEYTRWAAANPEKAAKEEERRKAKREREQERFTKSYFNKRNVGAWAEGHKAGKNVSLDPQADQVKPRGFLK